MSIDNKVVSSGSLLEDMSPPIMPAREIPDPNDSKPDDWDDRERIEDPDSVKPDDWDESAPAKIPDARYFFFKKSNYIFTLYCSASKPSGWLEDQPQMIPDPDAVRPEDWDDEMDGMFHWTQRIPL